MKRIILSAIYVILYATCTCAYHNLALRKPAWQKKDYSTSLPWGADKAVDGMYTDRSVVGNQCTISADKQQTAEWRVDLENVFSISHINIYYRTDNNPGTYVKRFAGFYLYVSNTTSKEDGILCFHELQTVSGTPIEDQRINCSVYGRYVIYYNERRRPDVVYPSYYSNYSFNELCEVEVYGCPVNCQGQQCDADSGDCLSGCLSGFEGPHCSYLNLALGRPAWQKHNWTDKQIAWGAGKAVDGKYSDRGAVGEQCTISGPSQSTAEWRVDLEKIISIRIIQIYYRTDNVASPGAYYRRFAGFYVYISNDTNKDSGHLCFHEMQQVNGTPTENQTINCAYDGRYVIYYNQRTRPAVTYPSYYSTYAYNELCELEVYGCPESKYFGQYCDRLCPENCLQQRCNISTGNCFECKPGYTGDRCGQECDGRMYGPACSQNCGHCLHNTQCHHINGTCSGGCSAGYEGSLCHKQCDAGRFGFGCNKTCGHCLNGAYCNHTEGSCSGGCSAGFKAPLCIDKCEEGTYGASCGKTCGQCLDNKPCNHINGSCAGGCSAGYEGTLCKKQCDDGNFGLKCNQTCGRCLNGDYCNHKDGSCSGGCSPGYKAPLCIDKCDSGMYGTSCNETCGFCFNDTQCHHVNGSCSHGCSAGYEGGICKKECEDGKYGLKCNQTCGNCYDGTDCHHENGTCLKGCSPGYTESLCKTECSGGTYGYNCNTSCGHCLNDTQCNHINGTCLQGCSAGYKGVLCSEECEIGLYGYKCNMSCGQCLNGTHCHHITGECPEGCSIGYKEPFCKDECDGGMYGPNCTQTCGNCHSARQCHHVNGTCLEGRCADGFWGSLCIQQIQSEEDNLPIVGGAIAAIVVVLVVIILVVIFIRRSRNLKGTDQETMKINEEINISTSSKKEMTGFTDIYENTKGLPQFKEKKINSEISKKAGQDVRSGNNEREDDIDNDEKLHDENPYGDFYLNEETIPDIDIEKLENVIKEKRKNEDDGFKREYAAMPYGEKYPCHAGKLPENVPKNRFKTTFPYDHSRIILSDSQSDYINANYIDGITKSKEYIAAQGPRQNTIKDFWTMIWQEKVDQIITLTNLKEGNKAKCSKYWPDLYQSTTFGVISLLAEEEQMYANYKIRKFRVTHKVHKKSRIVTQYHYTAWPDHGIPEPLCLVVFHDHVTRTTDRQNNCPILVHCSAGIGRTGTYIALDALYKAGKSEGKVNIAKYVKKMREGRMNMVQTYEQYKTIFLALEVVFKAPTCVLTKPEFTRKAELMTLDKPANESELRKEVQNLLRVRPRYTETAYKFALESSGSKLGVLPLDKYRLFLSSSVPKRGNYINAITLPSYTKNKAFIITPYPPVGDAVDFLRLLTDHESDIVICMDPLTKVESTKMWLPAANSKKSVAPFTVNCGQEQVTDIKCSTINIIQDGANDEGCSVSIIEPTGSLKIVENSQATLQMLHLVSSALQSKTEGPITVVSSDGAALCGIFCTVFNALQQLSMDGEVDILTAVRLLQIRRPELCSTLEEYMMIYNVVLDYIRAQEETTEENIYSNQ